MRFRNAGIYAFAAFWGLKSWEIRHTNKELAVTSAAAPPMMGIPAPKQVAV